MRSADRGTLFLDEIGDLPAAAQAALLRVLQEQEVRPVGATRPVRVDLRVLAATHRPSSASLRWASSAPTCSRGSRGHVIELPPLRARREDLGLILGELLGRAAPERAAGTQIHPATRRARC